MNDLSVHLKAMSEVAKERDHLRKMIDCKSANIESIKREFEERLARAEQAKERAEEDLAEFFFENQQEFRDLRALELALELANED